ncbi:hypothetical protein Patl1_25838 [Pistacia atlantica]|uniref:Uncharacterized protein n=1 Tax=Pistacia atlantica TaxID=434234 RepID=A0ACC1B3T7_9ROSI|nr:hypothetical protein Patl1_25838 [Pistacia atlantica]
MIPRTACEGDGFFGGGNDDGPFGGGGYGGRVWNFDGFGEQNWDESSLWSSNDFAFDFDYGVLVEWSNLWFDSIRCELRFTVPYSSKLDAFILKCPKKSPDSPLALRMIVLMFVMACGVYICSICIKQISNCTNTELLNIQVIDGPCPVPNIEPWEIP